MKKILPILLILLGTIGGAGAGLFLRPAPSLEAESAVECVPTNKDPIATAHPEEEGENAGDGKEYVKLNNQFVVPVIAQEKVNSLVLITLSLEVNSGDQERVFTLEPKLRDALLQTMFDHANIGGFHGAFTNSSNLDTLRQALLETARKVIGHTVSDVLILNIARQEV